MAQDTCWYTDNGSIDIPMLTDEAFGTSFLCVAIATDGDAGLATGQENGIGFTQSKTYAAGVQAQVRIQGVTLMRIASGSLNAGVMVTPSTGGVVTAASDGNFVYAKSLAQASGVNALVPGIIIPGCPQIEDVA